MRVLVLFLAFAAPLLSGCVSQSVTPNEALAPLDGLRTLGDAEVLTVTGHVTAPSAVPGAPVPATVPPLVPGQVDEQPLEVPEDALLVRLNLTWVAKGPTPETSDLDLYVFDEEGRQIGQAASLNDPETASIRITSKTPPGTWTLRTVNYANPETDYTITAEVFR